VLENADQAELRRRGLPGPAIAVLTGMRKPWRTAFTEREYRAARALGDDHRANFPRRIAEEGQALQKARLVGFLNRLFSETSTLASASTPAPIQANSEPSRICTQGANGVARSPNEQQLRRTSSVQQTRRTAFSAADFDASESLEDPAQGSFSKKKRCPRRRSE